MTRQDTASARDVVIERVFEASRELVWRAWTDPEHFVQWWGPHGFSTPFCTIDLQVGGLMRFCMRSEQYGDIWVGGAFDEVDAPARLAYRDYFTDEQGEIVQAAHYGMDPQLPLEMRVIMDFEEIEPGKTRMTLHHAIPATSPEHEGAYDGWNQSFDKLAAYLAQA